MKKIITLSALALALSAVAHASNGFDGCYQLYVPGAMYPALCLSGTMEEGIGGAGVRLVAFGTNTDIVKYCVRSTALGSTANSLTFVIGNRKDLILQNVIVRNGRKEGDAIMGSTKLKFIEIDEANSSRLMMKASSDPLCRR